MKAVASRLGHGDVYYYAKRDANALIERIDKVLPALIKSKAPKYE